MAAVRLSSSLANSLHNPNPSKSAPIHAALDNLSALLAEQIVFVPGSVDADPIVPANLKPINHAVASTESRKSMSSGEGTTASSSYGDQLPGRPTATSTSSSKPLQISWPSNFSVGCGLNNLGNTCFLNATLQALLHTPPFALGLLDGSVHSQANCIARKGPKGFCMVCLVQALVRESLVRRVGRGSMAPAEIVSKLPRLSKHFRRGRQEDAHEFLRFCTGAMQEAFLAGYPSKSHHKLRASTFLHRVFGGRLRSRVTCRRCQHPSDTYDDFLDLSLDVVRSSSVRQALAAFVNPDYLTGSNKYTCEKCKRPVEAEKAFTIDEAPFALTIHLKRFTPTGRKLHGMISYDERLDLTRCMSNPSIRREYSLCAIVSHSGSGPNSGHYYAHVRSPSGQWFRMDDSLVSPVGGSTHLQLQNAYLLFYVRTPARMPNVVSATNSTHKRKHSEEFSMSQRRPSILSNGSMRSGQMDELGTPVERKKARL